MAAASDSITNALEEATCPQCETLYSAEAGARLLHCAHLLCSGCEKDLKAVSHGYAECPICKVLLVTPSTLIPQIGLIGSALRAVVDEKQAMMVATDLLSKELAELKLKHQVALDDIDDINQMYIAKEAECADMQRVIEEMIDDEGIVYGNLRPHSTKKLVGRRPGDLTVSGTAFHFKGEKKSGLEFEIPYSIITSAQRTKHRVLFFIASTEWSEAIIEFGNQKLAYDFLHEIARIIPGVHIVNLRI